MPRDDKLNYTDKQRRMAEYIETGYEDLGLGAKEAQKRAWATVDRFDRRRKKERFGAGKM